jgi:hypothetical protein
MGTDTRGSDPIEREIVKVLLLGESIQGWSYLANRLRERGCECEVATSFDAACSLLEAEQYSVVLSPTRLHNKSLLPLMDLLEGSDVSLFYAEPVEDGSWWLPALRRGFKCFGSNGLRPSEFFSMLIETIDRAHSKGPMNPWPSQVRAA